MRKLAMSLVVAAVAVGGAALAVPAQAAPVAERIHAGQYHARTVQYYAPDWRAREEMRHRRHDEWRRREAWRRHHLEHRAW